MPCSNDIRYRTVSIEQKGKGNSEERPGRETRKGYELIRFELLQLTFVSK
jgi:hypothetical protein